MKVLLVEDDPLISRALDLYLTHSARYEVSVASNCGQARSLLDRETFDVLVVDVMLPDGDGIELVEEITATGAYRGPAVVLSAAAQTGVQERAERAGVVSFLVKPTEGKVLAAAIEQAKLEG